MRCQKVKDKLVAYLDGELSHIERDGIKEHLTHCSECGNEVKLLSGINESLKSSADIEVSSDFQAGFWVKLAEEKVRYKVFDWEHLFYRFRFIPFPVEVAAVLIIGIFLGMGIGRVAGHNKIEYAEKSYFNSLFSEVQTVSLTSAYLNIAR
ncbi:MAG: zf-HC2 domain-containing protein [Candidatus Omnitrophica bacterium]|nr:zf-HC2 domain-containing protein [Candidatus Omnitrophota bacterium]